MHSCYCLCILHSLSCKLYLFCPPPHFQTNDCNQCLLTFYTFPISSQKEMKHHNRTDKYRCHFLPKPHQNTSLKEMLSFYSKEINRISFFALNINRCMWQTATNSTHLSISRKANLIYHQYTPDGYMQEKEIWDDGVTMYFNDNLDNLRQGAVRSETSALLLNIKKRLLPRCLHHFNSDLINNMDHLHISGTEPSSVILSQNKVR